MKNRIPLFHFLLIGVFLFLFTQKSVAQELPDSLKNLVPNHIGFALDVFPFDLGLNLTFRLIKDLSLGVEGELGVNLSDPILLKISDSPTRDDLLGIIGGALFLTLHTTEYLKVDIGFRSESWMGGNISDGGFYVEQFTGIYTKLFLTSKIKVTEKGFKYKPTFGCRLSVGYFKTPSNIENVHKAFMLNLWVRIPLTDEQLYNTDESEKIK